VPVPAVVAEVTLSIETTPPGAEVSVGGVAQGKTPLSLTRKKDEVVELVFTLDGYQRETRTVPFSSDGKPSSVTLQKVPAPKPPDVPVKPDVKPDGAPKTNVTPVGKPTVPVKPDVKPDAKPPEPKPKPKPKKDDLKDVPF
jgi:hypothetical protein